VSRPLPSPQLWLFVCGALLLTGCPPAQDPGGGHSHTPDDGGHGHPHPDDDEKTEAITVFSARHELFIEHVFLLAGQATRFITHVTDVPARRARTEGSVTFVLQLGDAAPLRHEVPEVTRTGIYLPEITFPQAGEWTVSLEIPNPDGEDLVRLPNRTVYATQAEIDAAPQPGEHDGISFLKEQQWKLDFQTAPVVRRTLVERLQLPGRLLAPPTGRAQVSPPVAGRLLPPAGGGLPSLGQRVEAGQVLARVQPPKAGADTLVFLELRTEAAEAHAEVARAEVALRRAEQQLERVRGLAAQQAKSPREVEQAEYEQVRAQADVEAARRRAQLYAEVERRLSELPADVAQGFPAVELAAPIAGLLIEAAGAHGEQVAAGAPLFTILDRSRLLLEVIVPETALSRLPAEPDAVFTTPGQRQTFRPVLGDAGGRLLLGAEAVDPRTRAARLVYELPNPGDLAAGMAVEAFVATDTVAQALAIPTSALVEEEGRLVVFVMLGGETFEKRDLTLGIRDGDLVQVVSGLRQGERVVNRGAYAVKLASVATSIPAHGHAH
jgi:RND family efflux transporter MFP subunit